jgi:lipopolysaccharide transport system ATP-binding protein
MSLPAIEVSGLSKRYVLQHESRHDNLRDTLHHTARKLWRRARWGTSFETEEFMALNDVSFSVQPGEVVGIIGRNGAGKSTLLKILSRITEPTSGKITIRGRVASLLEVGTGFHPELSGRENIFLNGAILGMSRVEIRKKFDEIVAFAEVEKFLDTPVKRYSSGMYVRLAFAVAAHLESEILIVDEVLAVGDASFQKKCLGKMQDVTRQDGRTVMLVTHNTSVIASLCTSALYLTSGRLVGSGDVKAQLSAYYADGHSAEGEATWSPDNTRAGNAHVRFLNARILSCGQSTSQPVMSEDIHIEFDFEVYKAGASYNSSLHLHDETGVWILASGPSYSQALTAGRYRHCCRIPAGLLNDRGYTVTLFLLSNLSTVEIKLGEAVSFTVSDDGRARTEYFGPIGGVIRPLLEWKTGSIRDDRQA